MTTPRTRRGRPTGHDGAAPDSTNSTTVTRVERRNSTGTHREVPTAAAVVAAPPCADRRLWQLIVRCPWCSVPGVVALHVHRAVSAHGNVRQAGLRVRVLLARGGGVTS